MVENHHSSEEEPVCTTWARLVEVVLGLFLIVGTGFMAHYYAPPEPLPIPAAVRPVLTNDHQDELNQLTRDVDELKQEQAMPALVLNRYRNSICYIYGVYHVSMPGARPASARPHFRNRLCGGGRAAGHQSACCRTLVRRCRVRRPDQQGRQAGTGKAGGLLPGIPAAGRHHAPGSVGASGDLAVLQVENSQAISRLRPLPLAERASNPGELVAVVGYPMGVLGMVAKSPPAVYERLAYRRDDIGAANELAALSLIRPSATCGHLGDVVGDKLIYDAPTAHGGSGGPVFNSQGQVIGINEAYIDGFSGGTLGVSVQALRPLIAAAQKRIIASTPPPTKQPN